MSGGYGRGPEGYGEPGYDDEDYGQGYGGETGQQPSWDDPYWRQQGQPGARPAQGPAQDAGYGPEYGQQGAWPDPRSQGQYDPRAGQQPGQYDPGAGQQPGQYDPRAGQQQGQYDPGAGQQPGAYDPRSGQPGQYDPRAGQQPGQYDPRAGQRGTGPRPAQRGSGAQLPDPGTGSRPVQGGTGPARQLPRGYDPRGGDPRRASAGYPGDGYPAGSYQGRAGDPRVGQEGYDPDGHDDSFVPGLGRRDEFDGRPGPGRGRGGRYAGAPGGGYDDGRAGRRGAGGGGSGGGWDGRDEHRPRRRGPVRRLAPWIALLVILTPLAFGAYFVYHLWEKHKHPADFAGPGIAPAVTVQVKNGDNAFTLAPKLQSLGVIASSRAFEDAAEASANSAGLEVGYYKLKHHMQASLAWAALLNPKDRVQLTVTIPEGKRVSQTILLLAKGSNIPAADFQKVVDHPAALGLPSYAKGNVEGYLFPATYPIEPNETALQILQAMVARYNVEAKQDNLANAAKSVGLTPENLIIEASMAQAEGGSVSDYPKIARVIINRLHDGMRLQFDSVLLYGLRAYAVNVTQKQIDTPGPYNDFEHSGLPPGPISNPGHAAIEGILHPASGPWLYFLTVTGGKSEFSATPLKGQ